MFKSGGNEIRGIMQQEIIFGSRQLTYQLRFTERKTLGIQVHPSGLIAVFAPIYSTITEVKTKVRKKAPWILKQLDQFNQYLPGTPPRRYISGETHLYLGRQYRLKVVKANQLTVKAYRGQLCMHAKNTQPNALKKQLEKWYTLKAREIFVQVLEEIFPRLKRYLKNQPSLVIRKMSKRWGSCTQAGKIILNTELIKASKSCIEYVIIHELCHLVHHNHTKAFCQLLNRLMPSWKKNKLRLENLLA